MNDAASQSFEADELCTTGSAWREFMQRHGLEGEPAATDAESALRARKLLAEVEEREVRLAVKKREFVAMAEV